MAESLIDFAKKAVDTKTVMPMNRTTVAQSIISDKQERANRSVIPLLIVVKWNL